MGNLHISRIYGTGRLLPGRYEPETAVCSSNTANMPFRMKAKSSLRCYLVSATLQQALRAFRRRITYQLGDKVSERIVLLYIPAHLWLCISRQRIIQRDQQRHQTRPNQYSLFLCRFADEVVVREGPDGIWLCDGKRGVEERAQQREYQAPLERVDQV